MSDELVLSESMQLLVAGHETSSNGLSWLLYLLSTHPECLEKIRQEFDAVLGDAPLTFSAVPRLEFTTQVIQEALRLYPPFWMIDREAIADDLAGTWRYPGDRRLLCTFTARTMRRATGRTRSVSTQRASPNEPGAAHALHPSPLWGRTAGMHRQQLRDAAGPHDFERSAQEI